MTNYWLLKSEPSVFSIDDLARAPKKITAWEGVRNYQARNFLCKMQKGDLAFFYHSSCDVPGIVGIVEVVKTAYPDPTQEKDLQRWFAVDVKLVKTFASVITLPTLRANPALKNMLILRKGNRLSVTPVEEKEWRVIDIN